MSEQIEQKQSQMTTNYESAIEPSESEVQAIQIIERHEVHQTKILIVSGLQGQHDHEQASREVEVSQQQMTEENKDYEQFHDEPLETVQVSQSKNQFQQGPEEHYEPKAEQFDQFTDAEKNEVEEKIEVIEKQQKSPEKLPIQQTQEPQIKHQTVKTSVPKTFAEYQNSEPVEVQKQQKIQEKKQEPKIEQPTKSSKKKSKKKKQQQSEPLPIIGADSEEGKKQILSDKKIKSESDKKVEQQIKREPIVDSNNQNADNNNNNNQQGRQNMMRQESNEVEVSEIKEQVSQIVDAGSVAAGLIIFEAQRERIASTLDYFLKFTTKHEKHTTSQKQLIMNVEDQIQKKKQAKTPLCNMLRDYFEQYVNLCKNLYERSYKYTKNEKIVSANPMINMKQQLKAGIDELIFLRKSTGNQFNRLGEFIANTPQKNLVKLFNDYWKAIDTAQIKHKEKKDQFLKKEKQFLKRIAKVVKVYTKGKQGVSQQEDLFIEMTKYINQEQDYRKTLIEYGQSLIPLKKAFIKAEEILYEQLQVIFNSYKNQFRSLYSLHPKEFTLLQKMQKQIREKNTFEKLSDITDSDYVRSVLLNHQKTTIQHLTDREFEKVLGLVHFEEIIGNPIELLKGTTSKSFELKNKTQQVVDTISGNLLIFNKESAQMKQKFIIKNINAKIVQQGVVEIDQVIKGLIFNSNRTVRITFRDNDRAEQLICFLNQIHENIKENEMANNGKK